MTAVDERPASVGPFTHGAFLYADDDEYLAVTVPFVQEGLDAGEPVLVAVPTPRLELLRPHLAHGEDELLRLVSMEDMGRNPAWIIPAWADFVAPHAAAGRPARGIGEPIWHGRTDDELVECGRHEALLNLAFAGAAGFNLLCPYDMVSLDPAVLDEAHRNHPRITHAGGATTAGSYTGEIPALLDSPLPPVPPAAEVLVFEHGALGPVRQRAAEIAAAAGVAEERVDDLVLAVSEAVTNSVRHGGGSGSVALWRDGARFLCEVRDKGRIADPLAGRTKPGLDRSDGRGLWLIHQLCDLVQMRALPHGQAIRLHIAV